MNRAWVRGQLKWVVSENAMIKSKIINNLVYSMISQVITLSLSILIPRMFILHYGSEMNGLLSSVKHIFVFIALLDAGVGVASMQALYAPVAKEDRRGISAIVVATHNYFKKTGIFYGLAVIVLAIVYPLMIKSGIPFHVVALVIALQGAGGVIRYFFQGKFAILLQVEGKGYVLTNLTTIVTILSNTAQIMLILNGFDVIAVQTAYFIIGLVQMFYIYYYIHKHYPWLDFKIPPNYQALSQKNSVLLHNICGLVFYNTDAIILTIFCGLDVVSVYTLYALLIAIVGNLIDSVSFSFAFALGQVFNLDRKRYEKLQMAYETYYLALVFSLFAIALIFMLPFLRLYTEGITDADYIDPVLPYLFVGIQLLNFGRRSSSQIINFAGHFKNTQWRSVFETFINLTVSLAFVQSLGIYGVLIGTICALLYRANDIILYANRHIMHRSPWPTYRRWLLNLGLFAVVVFVCNQIPMNLSSYGRVIAWTMALGLPIVAVFIGVASMFEPEARRLVYTYIRPYATKLSKCSSAWGKT